LRAPLEAGRSNPIGQQTSVNLWDCFVVPPQAGLLAMTLKGQLLPHDLLMKLPRSFFQRKTLTVAKELLGCFLVRKIGRQQIIAKIIETEAYCGPKDLANHAAKGLTKRTAVMFGRAGHAYIYLIYGMYYCFNIVTEEQGYPAAVLIRGVEINKSKIVGPGKVCRELKIDKRLNGVDLINDKRFSIVDRLSGGGFSRRKPLIKKLPRVGVDYAGEWAKKKWRFVLVE